MERNNGTQTQTFTVVPDAIKIMRSSDGGDLVVAQINSEWTRAAGDGRESLPASDEEQALFGDGTATSTMKVTYVNIVALYRAAGGFRGTDHGGRCGTQADQGRGDLIPTDFLPIEPRRRAGFDHISTAFGRRLPPRESSVPYGDTAAMPLGNRTILGGAME